MSQSAPAEDHTPQTVTKKEASDILNCTTKSIERYAAAGRLTKFENRGPRRNEVHYLESDVLKLKDELQSDTPAARLVTKTDRDRQSTEALQTVSRDVFTSMLEAIAGQHAITQRQAEIIEKQSSLIEQMLESKALPPANTDVRQTETDSAVSISDKPLLKLKEAAALTGLSAAHLSEAIHTKKLKARIIGRGWRIKRADLDAYLKKL